MTVGAIVVRVSFTVILMNNDTYSKVLCCGVDFQLPSPDSVFSEQTQILVGLSIFVTIQGKFLALAVMSVIER